MNRIAIYPGSFDPVTHGHLDIVRRAAGIFDSVIVAVTDPGGKKTLFPLRERVELFGKAVRGWPRVSVQSFKGLLVDYATEKKACAIVRGLRAVSDFEYEFQMALMNRHLSKRRGSSLETVYMMPDESYTYLSSSLVKEVARLKGDIDHFVPPAVCTALKKYIK
ncbi:MAG: pantetheine-phosphate adenylyltransferase [Elusimicrobia bacterium RIFCSPLOWO2_01_FULL_60_11]|nr:MAG: pantetheine-phosphate adenylyltransferase [Elusimicrobia bacterium RIFCSPLOWO2_01_FULL_60_11]